MIDLTATLGRLAHGGGENSPRLSSSAPREGFAAVETGRGALYHWARLSTDDKIADYAILAPTEWNFHPAGPFVATLLGARMPRGRAAEAITRLAALFDPCVAFHVELEEAVHA
nr:nickel-dependent hydrogenase large subunit [Methylosinus sp. Sm6]